MKKEYDLKKLKRKPSKTKVDAESATKSQISLRLDVEVLIKLKEEAAKLGLPYQTLIGSVLHQFVSGELIEKKTIKILQKLGKGA